MLEQISWIYSFSSNNWWKLAIIAIVLKIIFRLMYVWMDDIDSVAYSITTAIVYVMSLFTIVLTVIALIITIGSRSDGKPTNMVNIPNLTVTAENNIVTIKSLPKNFKYTEVDGQRLKPSIDQKFKYEVNQDFGTAYLISEDGVKFKLSDEDKEYLKERGAR